MGTYPTRKDRREPVTSDRVASRKARARQYRDDDRAARRETVRWAR